jgi:hypothetical protein
MDFVMRRRHYAMREDIGTGPPQRPAMVGDIEGYDGKGGLFVSLDRDTGALQVHHGPGSQESLTRATLLGAQVAFRYSGRIAVCSACGPVVPKSILIAGCLPTLGEVKAALIGLDWSKFCLEHFESHAAGACKSCRVARAADL